MSTSRGRLRRWRVVVLVAGAPLLIACGALTSPIPSSGSGSGLPPDLAEVEARADAISEAIGGNATQREAVHWLQVHPEQRSFALCMSRRGFDIDPGFSPLWTGYRSNGTSGRWMGALDRPPSDTMLAIAESSRSESRRATPEQSTKRYRQASSACSRRSDGGTYYAGGAGPDVPQGANELHVQFSKLLARVESQLGPIKPYTGCMKRHDVDYLSHSEGEQGWQGLYMYLSAMAPGAPTDGEEASDAWKSYLSLEDKALSADTACRGPKYREGLTKLAPLLDDLESRHSDDLAEVRRGWDVTVARAKQQGFNPNA